MKLRVWILLLCALPAWSGDLGFRFVDGRCVNGQGEEGLNPEYFGECGDWRGRTINQFDFSLMSLKGSQFDGAGIYDSDFQGADLSNVSFFEVYAQRTKFNRVVFLETKLEGSNFQSCEFRNADLSEVNGVDTSFFLSDLKEARVELSDFRRIEFFQSKLDRMKWSDTDLRGSWMTDSELYGVEFVESDLRFVEINRVTAKKLRVINSSLEGSVLSDSILYGALFSQSNLKKTNWETINLWSASFYQEDLSDALFSDISIDASTVFSKDPGIAENQINRRKKPKYLVLSDLQYFNDSFVPEFERSRERMETEYQVEVIQRNHSTFDGGLLLREEIDAVILPNVQIIGLTFGALRHLESYVRNGGTLLFQSGLNPDNLRNKGLDFSPGRFSFEMARNAGFVKDLILADHDYGCYTNFESARTTPIQRNWIDADTEWQNREGKLIGYAAPTNIRKFTVGSPVRRLIEMDLRYYSSLPLTKNAPLLLGREVGQGRVLQFLASGFPPTSLENSVLDYEIVLKILKNSVDVIAMRKNYR